MLRTSVTFAAACALLFAPTFGTAQAAENAMHWAFRPPKKAEVPAVKEATLAKTDIDRFILAKLEAAGLQPAKPADPRTLIRRMSYDLTGLPPSNDEVSAFVKAAAADADTAVNALIERLLVSPRYGERWGRHWLDVARYSDTKGYVYSREERRFPHSAAYRQWVIRAFNEDLRYDRFLQLQIAADQLVAPDSPDLAAMGFITVGRRFIGVTHDIIDDRIDVVTRGAMGLTVQCARCHDHKYDPVSIEDYYALYGVFHASNDRLVPLAAVEDAELSKRRAKLAERMKKHREDAAARLRARVGDYLAAQLELKKYPEEGFDQILAPDDIIPASVRRWRDFLHVAKDSMHPIFAPWIELSKIESSKFAVEVGPALRALRGKGKLNPLVEAAFETPPESPADAAARYTKLFAAAAKQESAAAAELRAFLEDPNSPVSVPDTGIVNNDQFFPFNAIEELWKLQGDVERRMIDLGTPSALVLVDGAPEPNPRVFKRGSPSRPGDEVPRRMPEILGGADDAPFKQGSGRLELAKAVASAGNPLTARVMVNRIWQHHFGVGLVRTPSDFGLRAEAPSHPELLDWLALRFIESGWSVKAMHRLILSSAVYRQQSAGGPRAEKDPENRLLASFPSRRMDFEQLRDGMLAVAGDLDLATTAPAGSLTDSANRRRTVYAFIDRQFLPGVLRTFDFANPDIHVAVRHETAVPQQALFFLNGSFSAERARSIVRRESDGDPVARIQRLFSAIFQRAATDREVATATSFLRASEAGFEPPAPPVKSQWLYGTGGYDDAAKRLKNFTPLPHFAGDSWQGADQWPGGATGWAQLTSTGGHPGNTLEYASVRRWVAPADATIDIHGTLVHEPEPGDGVRAFIVSSRHGELKAVRAHKSKVAMDVASLELKAGDTIDFIVDIGGTLNSDQFLWAPTIRAAGASWDAKSEFAGPSRAASFLAPWEQLAQVLLLSNEFAFLD